MCLAAGSIWGLSHSPLVWDKSTKTPAVHSCLDKSKASFGGKKANDVNEVKLDTRTGGYTADAENVWQNPAFFQSDILRAVATLS